jgi:hypothetical protein
LRRPRTVTAFELSHALSLFAREWVHIGPHVELPLYPRVEESRRHRRLADIAAHVATWASSPPGSSAPTAGGLAPEPEADPGRPDRGRHCEPVVPDVLDAHAVGEAVAAARQDAIIWRPRWTVRASPATSTALSRRPTGCVAERLDDRPQHQAQAADRQEPAGQVRGGAAGVLEPVDKGCRPDRRAVIVSIWSLSGVLR